jgi:NAD(P) transhydrogenase subunit beta
MSLPIQIAYIIAFSFFIFGIKGMTKPRTARKGNFQAAIGMLIAIVVTLIDKTVVSYELILAGVLLGTVIGVLVATKIQMTSMPELVAALNGFGGGASIAVAAASYLGTDAQELSLVANVAITLTILIGSVTLTGSFVAFLKLSEKISGNSIGFAGMKAVNAILFLSSLAAIGYLAVNPGNTEVFYGLIAVASVLGILLVLPIGGADMPVVIALLNSYSGIAAAFAGFIIGNTLLIVAGSLVGASGLILTNIMCVAMNRSLTNVLFGVMAEGAEAIDADEVYEGKVKSASADEISMILEDAQRVVIVPGYGLAMAQAQHAVRELADVLENRGVEVEYAIHPVAGRMPGHMNVLLAEAEVDYDKMVEMDRINPTFEQTDVAIVIGANDVTNPMAREDKGSPIYGMPILNVDKAKTVVVIKRSLSAGFAGLPNPLFAKDNTLMVFGDGKQAVIDVTSSLNEAA